MNYIGVVDFRERVCWIEPPSNFHTSDTMATYHKRMMIELNLWRRYQKLIKHPAANFHEISRYGGFAHYKGEWLPRSCTLNPALSSANDDLLVQTVKISGKQGMDGNAKKEGINLMKPLLWLPLKSQLDDMTN